MRSQSAERSGEETHDHVTGRKGERARRAETLTLIVQSGREVGGMVRRTGLVPVRTLSAGGKLRRAGTRCGDLRFATKRNVVNPRIGSRAKQTCTVEEENPSRWCKTTRAAREASGSSPPKGRAETRSPGVGFLDSVRWRGGLWKPQERNFGRMAGTYGSGRDGRAGVKVKRVERAFVFQAFRALVVRTSRIPAHAASLRGRRSRRGAVKQNTAESIRVLPPWRTRPVW